MDSSYVTGGKAAVSGLKAVIFRVNLTGPQFLIVFFVQPTDFVSFMGSGARKEPVYLVQQVCLCLLSVSRRDRNNSYALEIYETLL